MASNLGNLDQSIRPLLLAVATLLAAVGCAKKEESAAAPSPNATAAAAEEAQPAPAEAAPTTPDEAVSATAATEEYGENAAAAEQATLGYTPPPKMTHPRVSPIWGESADPTSASDAASWPPMGADISEKGNLSTGETDAASAPIPTEPSPQPAPAPEPAPIAAGAPSPVTETKPPPQEPPPPSWHVATLESCFFDFLGVRCPFVSHVTRDEHYVLDVSLASFAKAIRNTVRVSPGVESATGPGAVRTTLLNVVPIFAGANIQPRSGTATVPFEMEVKRGILGAPNVEAYESYSRGDLSPADYVFKVRAGHVEIPFYVTESAGDCGQIALSIWDKGIKTALDSVVARIPIGRSDGCGPIDSEAKPLVYSGADSLLLTGADTASATVGVGMHVFQSPLSSGSYVVIATRNGKTTWVGGWMMDSPLTEVIGEKGVLLELVRQARKSLWSENQDVSSRAYLPVAETLLRKLFSARSGQGSGQMKAEEARCRVRDIFKQTHDPITLVGRFSIPSPDGSSLYYVPLRLMAVPNAGLLTEDHPVDVVLPLRRNLHDAGTCIRKWTVIASPLLIEANDKDQKAVAALKTIIDRPRQNWREPTRVTAAEMLKFFGSTATDVAPIADNEAEGVVVLTHHSAGRGLSFGDAQSLGIDDQNLDIERLKRDFNKGSVALLGACSVADPESADRIIDRLNLRGVESMIVSPFPVSTGYTVRFADQFIDAVDMAYTASEQPTVRELFDRAARATAATYTQQEVMQQQALEFVLAGDPNIRLCAQPSQENKNENP